MLTDALSSAVRFGSNPRIASHLASLRVEAENGNRQAQLLLGGAYEYGLGTNLDYRQAAEWYRKAADQELPEAQGKLGLFYLTGSGVERDYPAALYWFLRGATQGDVGAQVNLSYMYCHGVGVKRDLYEAFRWMSKAADHGLPIADSYLADMYEQGVGTERNFQPRGALQPACFRCPRCTYPMVLLERFAPCTFSFFIRSSTLDSS